MKILIEDGYVVSARCGMGHSGNHGLAPMDQCGQYYECQGCRAIWVREEVERALSSPGGEIGSDRVIA